MQRISQFNTFPFEDHVRFFETKGCKPGCKHEWNEWTSWTSTGPEGWKRYGRHCKKCPKWECLAEADVNPKFKYKIHIVNCGVVLVLTYNVTGESKDFYIAGASPCNIELHMRNMTDSLMESWFVKPVRKKKKAK
jgi:hypothetical protein